MKDSTLSMKVFAAYLVILSFLLLFWPSSFLLLGFESISNPWVPMLGYMVGSLAFVYFMAIRANATNFYSWTVYTRLPLALFYAVLVAFGKVPATLLLVGLFETGCAIWTSVALKHELLGQGEANV